MNNFHFISGYRKSTSILADFYKILRRLTTLLSDRLYLLRRIFGPTKERDATWKIKTNDELNELIRYKNIINYIKHKD
jgi:hypothetical protein